MTATFTRRTVNDLPADPSHGSHHNIRPMSEVLDLPSADRGDYPTEYGLVREVLPFKRQDPGYPALVESIREWGLAVGFAPDSGGDMQTQGHHRVAALIDLGAAWCPVSDIEWPEHAAWVAPDGSTPAPCTYCHPEVGCDCL